MTDGLQPGPNGCPFCIDSTNPDLMGHVRNAHPDEFCCWAHGPGCSNALNDALDIDSGLAATINQVRRSS